MDWLALLGVLCIAYGVFAIFVAIKKPDQIWQMKKIQAFLRRLGSTGTVIWFCVFGLAIAGLGVWLLLR
ncbi:MAG TPA: hypothetical protein VN421_02145 [Pseudoflavonifractor sp.]|nr:hypothetical protein [Pseudoflavonifractor sp.]